MNVADLQKWISHPEELNKETLYELRTLLVRYPYCQTLRLLFLKNLYVLHDITFGAELRKSVFYVADRRTLFYLIEGDKYLLPGRKRNISLVAELKEEPGLDRTISLIDAFLAINPEESSLQEGFDYALDYTSYLLETGIDNVHEENQSSKLRGHDLIDSFIAKAESEASVKLRLLHEEGEDGDALIEHSDSAHREEDEDDGYFTETLAKIYVKQRRYSKALEIIKKLSLKYPKKNAYFADQIRFLEKLIINAKSK